MRKLNEGVKRGFLGVCVVILLLWVNQGKAAAIWPFVNDSTRVDSLNMSYGQITWDQNNSPFLHSASDILNPSRTGVISADSGYFEGKGFTGPTGDTAYFAIAIGEGQRSDCYGWCYTHATPESVRGDTIKVGDPISQGERFANLYPFPNTAHDTLSHLHFEKVFGWNNGNHGDGFGPGKEVPRICANNIPPGWSKVFRVANPLDSLPQKPDTIPPHFGDSLNPIRLQPDPINLSNFRRIYRPYQVGDSITRDSMYVVARQADVEGYVYDRERSRNKWKVGIYKIYYEIHGKGSQVQKGFEFTGKVTGKIVDTETSQDIALRVYSSTSQIKPFLYLVSNTDSIIRDFDDQTNGIHSVPANLWGYWNTRQHKDRTWNSPDSAESLRVAKFPDGYYWVLVNAYDKVGNLKKDSIKVIVNNFPPRVKQTYPDSGELGVPRGCTLQVWFDQPMDTASVRSGFRLHLAGDTTSIQGTAWFLNQCDTLMYFKPTNPLGLDAAYVMTFPSTTKDIADSTMGVNYEAWFSTQPRDLHVSYYSSGSGVSQIEVRNNRFRTPPRQVYAEYYPASPFHLYGQKIALDRDGNRYLCEDVNSSGENRVAKYDTSGTLVDSCLLGQRCLGITTDGDTLFVTLPLDSSRTHLYNHVMRLNLNGDTLLRWRSPDSAALEDVCYSPAANKVFALCWKWKRDTLPTSPWYVYALTLDRYTEAGQREASLNIPLSPTNPSWRPFRLISGKNRLFLARTWDAFSGFMRGDTVVMYDWDLNEVGTRFAAGDGDPVCDYRRVFSMTADKWNLYTLIKSYNVSGPVYYWVHVFTPTGSPVRICNLLTTPGGAGFGALAVYPSVLDTAGGFSEWGGGIGDGGPQIAVLNSLLPRVYALGQCYPNPAKAGLRIDYALPKESRVSLRVFNVMGQLVRTLRDGKEKPGFYKAEWDGKDQNSHRVASGVYLYRMEAGEFRKTRKLVVVR